MRAQRCGGPKICPMLFLKRFFWEEGALLEYLHAGPLQPCYATVHSRGYVTVTSFGTIDIFWRGETELLQFCDWIINYLKNKYAQSHMPLLYDGSAL